jgi:chromosomal replication initiation ATPase DnaA
MELNKLEILKDIVNAAFHVDISTKRRTAHLVMAKQIFCFIATKNRYKFGLIYHYENPLVYVGKYISSDHTIVMYNRRKVSDLLSIQDEKIVRNVNKVENLYKSMLESIEKNELAIA